MSDKYYEAVERFANKYSSTKGVISIEPDQFGADIIVVLVDDKRYKNLDLPKSFADYEVSPVGIYATRDIYEHLVGIHIVNEPSIWDVDYQVPYSQSLDNIQEIINQYEQKIQESIDNSLAKIRDTMQWTIQNVPDQKDQ